MNASKRKTYRDLPVEPWMGRPTLWAERSGIHHVALSAATVGRGVVTRLACGGASTMWGVEVTTWYGQKHRGHNDLSLPLDIVTMRTAVYGDSGAGKTTFARLLAEKVHDAQHRFCAIDLKNDWYGLKSSADGASAGIPVVIFGGPRGDVKLFDDAGGPARWPTPSRRSSSRSSSTWTR
jgi:hypothetical protein